MILPWVALAVSVSWAMPQPALAKDPVPGATPPPSPSPFLLDANQQPAGAPDLDPVAQPRGPESAPAPTLSGHPYFHNPRLTDVQPLVGVDAVTGALTRSSLDLELVGAPGLSFTRSYNSLALGDGSLGPGWHHNFDYRLVEAAGSVTLDLPDGYSVVFPVTANGSIARPARADFALDGAPGARLVTDTDRTQYHFDSANRLTSIAQLNGQVTTLGYQDGRLDSVTNRSGRLTLSYTGDRISAVADSAGRRVGYGYDESGRLVSFTDCDGDEYRYVYDTAGHLAQLRNVGGVVFQEQAFDGLGRVTEQFLAGEGAVRLSYDTAARQNTVTYADGATVTFSYDPDFEVTSIQDAAGRRAYSYATGRLVAYSDRLARTTRFEYDGWGDITRTVYPDGSEELRSYNSDNQLVAVTSQDPSGHERVDQSYQVDSQGNVTEQTDGRGNRTTFAYNSQGDRLKRTDSLNRTWSSTYDSAGRVLSETDPGGHTTTHDYDAAGRVIKDTDAAGQSTTYIFSPGGRHLSTTDALGHREDYDVDPDGTRQQTTDSQGYITRYDYNAQNKLVALTDKNGFVQSYGYDDRGFVASSVDPEGTVSRFRYDAQGRITGLTDRRGNTTSFGYTAEGDPLSVTAPDGTVTTATYDARGRVASLTNGRGFTTTYAYDFLGRLTRETDALGQSTTYQYDAAGNLVATTDKNGHTWTYAFDGENQQIASTNPLGQTDQRAWDADGHVVETVTPGQARTRSTYDALGRLIASVDPLGHETAYSYDALGRQTKVTHPDGTTSTSAYDAAGHVVKTVDEAGAATSYVYDKNGRMTRQVNPAGGVAESAYDKNGRPVASGGATTTYDANGNVLTVTNAAGGVTSYAYDAKNQLVAVTDPNGFTRSLEHDADGNITAVTNPGELGTIRYGYDELDRLVSTTDAEGYTTGLAYDPNGNVIRETDARGNSLTHEYDGLNRLVATTDALGRTTRQEYDADGRPTKLTDARGGVTATEYDADGRAVRVTDALGHDTRFDYDSLDRLVSQTDANGAVTRYSYTPTGRVASVTDGQSHTTSYTYDKLGNCLTATDPLGRVTRYAYDGGSQVTSVTDPLGATERFSYDALGRVLKATDKNGHATSYAYDGNDNIVAITDAAGTVTTFAYDAMNQLTRLETHRVDAQAGVDERQITLYTYDRRGLLTTTVDAQRNVTTNTYDAFGNLTETVDADGFTTTTSFDPRNLPEQVNIRAAGTGAPELTARFSYDESGNLVVADDWTGHLSLAYDLLSRLTSVTDQSGQTTRYDYDAVGNQIRLTYPDHSTVTKGYNTLSQLTSVTGSPQAAGAAPSSPVPSGLSALPAAIRSLLDSLRLLGGPWLSLSPNAAPVSPPSPPPAAPEPASASSSSATTYGYDAAGQLTSIGYPNGRREQRTYDRAGRLTQVLDDVPGKTKLDLKYEYSYDAQGNLTWEFARESPAGPKEKNSFTYDALNRLTSRQDRVSGTQETYSYDTVGNLVKDSTGTKAKQTTTTTTTYNSLNQQTGGQVIDAKGKTREKWINTFDRRGNLVEVNDQAAKGVTPTGPGAGVTRYSFDGTNRLAQGVGPDGRRSVYRYNSLGALVGRTEQAAGQANTNWAFTVDYSSPLLADLAATASNGLAYRYTDGVDRLAVDVSAPAATGSASQRNAATFVYHHDRQGSTVGMTDAAGQVVSSVGYDEWGAPSSSGSLSWGGRTLDVATSYAGYDWDPTLGLYEAGARVYDSARRRFLSPDPAAEIERNRQDTAPYPGGPQVSRWVSQGPTRSGVSSYVYGEDNPVAYVDPTGLDAILINKIVDYTNIGKLDHMSAFFQDANDDWYFFFWGDDVEVMKVTDTSIFRDMDAVNHYLWDFGANRSDADPASHGKPYFKSVYIKGDFTASLQQTMDLKAEYDASLSGPLHLKLLYKKMGVTNQEYRLFTRNCGQVVMKALFLGTLPDGTSVKQYAKDNHKKISMRPGVNLKRMQQIFYNKALTLQGFQDSVQAQYDKLASRGGSSQWLRRGDWKNLNVIMGNPPPSSSTPVQTSSAPPASPSLMPTAYWHTAADSADLAFAAAAAAGP